MKEGKNQFELQSLTKTKTKDKMSKKKSKVTFVNYDWDAIIDWAKEKCEKKEPTESAAPKDLLENEEEQFEIIDEIEIKQEIVLEPNG